MIKIIVLASILGYTCCARLDNLYLPPNQASFAFEGNYNGGPAQAYSPSRGVNQVPIIKFAADNNGEGTYRYNYEAANGITAQEQGDARGDGTKAHGSYSYTAPDGQHISVTYIADENGFVPQGSHFPTPPPVPEAILKSLQENAAAEAKGIFDDGQYRGEGQSVGAFGKNAAAAGGYSSNGGYKY